MSTAALHNHGISGSRSLYNTAATPTGPSNPESDLTTSRRLHPRSSKDVRNKRDKPWNRERLDPGRCHIVLTIRLSLSSNDSQVMMTEDSRPPFTGICEEPPVPSSSSAPPSRGYGLQDQHLLPSSLLLSIYLKTGTPGYRRSTP